MPTVQNRRGTAANLTSANPVLSAGEIAFETDTRRFKLGDGTTAWNSLPYADSAVGSANQVIYKNTSNVTSGNANFTFNDSTNTFAIQNISITTNTISSTNTNGNIVLAPNGTGDVYVDADTLRVGDANANATLTTNGTGNLILNTNAGTNSGSITIAQGANSNITIAPNGTGSINIPNGSATSPSIHSTTGTVDTGLFFPATDSVGITTAGVERFRIDSTGAMTAVIVSGSTRYPMFACRAWVNFNGTGTIAIRGQGNVTSIGDGGVGLYTVNFTTAMPDANYAVCTSCYATGTDRFSSAMDTYATGSVRIRGMSNATSALIDLENCNVAIFR